MYCIPLQAALSHEIQYITFEVVQLYSLPRLIEKLVLALLTLFVVVMNGQALHLALLHLFIPAVCLEGLLCSGSLVFTRRLFREEFLGCL